MSNGNSLGKRWIALLLSIMLIFGMMPTGIVYAEATAYGVVEGITAGATVDGADTAAPVVTYSAPELSWSAADTSIGRYSDGWWVGIKITAPADMTTEADFANVKYQSMSGGVWSGDKSFWNAQDSDKNAADTPRYLTMWGLVDEANLKYANQNDRDLEYKWQFDWDADGVFEQVVTLRLDPTNMELTKDGQTVYPAAGLGYGTMEMITGGAEITGNGTADVVLVNNTKTAIAWCPADTSIGRNQDGWWIGAKINAPAGITEEQLKVANYTSGTSGAKSFWAAKDSQEGADNHYMTMWVPLNALMSGNDVSYQWRFDWNNDGIYEQTVTLNVNADNVVLTQDGSQVYPALGAVSSYSGGTVEGSATSDVTVTITEANLNWSPADPSIGRNQDAWWVGIKVDAPAGMTADVLENSKFQSNSGSGWSDDKLFWSYKDSADSDASHYIQMWMPLTNESLASAQQNGENVTREYQFDWDNDGTFEQLITFQVVPSDKIVLNKAGQTGFAFAADIEKEITWQEDLLDILKVEGGQGEGAVSYSITDGTDVAEIVDGKIKLLSAGSFTVTAVKASDNFYTESTAKITIKVNPADQTEFEFSGIQGEKNNKNVFITYDPNNNQYAQAASGAKSGKNVTYSIINSSADDVATIDPQTGVLTIHKAGTVTVRAYVEGNNRYNESDATYTLTIGKAEQTDFGFADDVVTEIIYSQDLQERPEANGGQSDGTVFYTITEGTDVAEIVGEQIKLKKAGTFTLQAVKPGNESYLDSAPATIVITVEKATRTFEFADGLDVKKEYGIKSYTNELKFYPALSNGDDQKLSGTISGDDIGAYVDPSGNVTFNDSEVKVGTVIITVTMPEDECYKACPATYKLTLGYHNPDGQVTVDGEKHDNDNAWYYTDVRIIAPEGYQISYSNELSTSDWAKEQEYKVDGITSPTVYLKHEESGAITDAITAPEILLDSQAPTALDITYSNYIWETIAKDIFGYQPDAVTMHITESASANPASDIARVEYSTDGGTTFTDAEELSDGSFSLRLPTKYRDTVILKVTDVAGNTSTNLTDGTILVVDQDAPVISANYTGVFTNTADGVYYAKDEGFEAEFVITDDNYDLRSNDPVVMVNDSEKKLNWSDDGKSTLSFDEDGTYEIQVDFRDRNENDAEPFKSTIVIDRTAPVINVSYGNKDVINTIDGRDYFADTQTVTIVVTEINFVAQNMTVTVNGASEEDKAYWTAYAKNDSNWKHNEDNTHELTLTFSKDAHYTITVDGKDFLENEAEAKTFEFTVDTVAPENVKITYDQSILDTILDGLTFGVFNAPVTVTITAEDVTAGVQCIKYNYGDETGEGTGNSVTFTIDPEFKGTVTATAYDKAGNASESQTIGTDGGGKTMGGIVIDTVAPTRTVSYDPSRVVDAQTLKDADKKFSESDDVILYYNKDAVVTFKIKESNFDSKCVDVKVNGETVTVEDWKNTNDEWTGTITLKQEGDYVVTMDYTDHSTNAMESYTSQRIVIDKTAPVINVTYGNKDVMNTVDGRDYFADTQTATITIKEQNFRADDVVIMVTAKDAVGKDLLALNADGTVTSYANQGKSRDSWSAYKAGTWRRDDNTYVLNLTFSAEANYTFDVVYQDLATNQAKDYAVDAFTVDKTAPSNLTISYSNSIQSRILEAITFNYYNAPVTVTITANDTISGIHSFAYSYLKGANVSGVNAQLLEQAIRSANITYDGYKATATFQVPQGVLGNNNQFDGTVGFTAYDCSKNNTALQDTARLVVDNISPTANVTYAGSVQEVNGVTYFDGNIQGNININEANFASQDVVVTVTKDGNAYPVNVAWYDNSVDSHSGSFVLTEEGNYVVTVTYTDRSGNQMADYTSGRLTLDTTAPTVKVSNIKANSANKDEEYGFSIEINDTNLDGASLKPVLSAVIKNEDGVYTTQEIDLGKPAVTDNGQTYTYTVPNLPDDAIYTLTCEAKDLAGNTVTEMLLDDGEAYEQVQFSINRSGSTFAFGSEYSEDLVGLYYVYSVYEDLVIIETNVDPIEEYSVMVNGTELTEGVDYTTEQTTEPGQWSKRVYTISKDLFTAEGQYNVIVSSTDKTDTTAFSDVKDLAAAFVVDQKKPVLTITGLESGGRYQTSVQTVTLIPMDEGGALNSLRVVLLDSDGNPLTDENGTDISVRFDMSGKEFYEYLEEHDGKVTFTIPEGLNNQVQIICNDCAVNAEGRTNEYDEIFARVTVSPNQLVIFYANTPLLIGTLIGILLLLLLIILLLVKRKKDKEEKKSAKSKA